jgi:kynurenine formamidase
VTSTCKACLIAIAVCAVLVAADQPLDKATLDHWMQELSNWGRWGKNDQLGTVNLITAAKRKAAAGLVKEGFSVSLSSDAETVKSADNEFPFEQEMIATGTDPNPMFGMDIYRTRYHGKVLTHLDALSHMFYQGKMYNGYPQEQVNRQGAQQLAVTAYKNGLTSRGILMDIPALKGVKYLELSTPVYPADLDAWEKKAGIKVAAGDIVFVRTGRWARRAEKGPWDTEVSAAGMHASCARWFHQRDVAMVGSDTHGELMPSPVAGVAFPMHQLLLIAMGTPMFDNCDLEPLSQAAGSRHRWEFLVTAAPLAVPKGTGSPVNPIAIF